MDRDIQKLTKEVALQVGRDILTDFNSTVETEKDRARKVDNSLRFIRSTNGITSNDLKGLALAVQLAKAMGLKGDRLQPLLDQVFPESPASGDVASKPPEPLAPAGSTS